MLDFIKQYIGPIFGVLLLVVLGPLGIWFGNTAAIPAGHVGILSTFGHVEDSILEPGFQWVWFFRTVTPLTLQTQTEEEDAITPTKEGLSITMHVVALYSLKPDQAVSMFKKVGKDYQKIVEAQLRSAIRDTTVQFKAEDLYTANRSQIEGKLFSTLTNLLDEWGVVVQGVAMSNPSLPKAVGDRVEAKLAAEQDNLRMEFVIQQAEKEAHRKAVEAKGIADAQAIIKKDLDDHYLRYLWIEALKETAKHNNAVYYVPVGNDGMPIFKNVEPKGCKQP